MERWKDNNYANDWTGVPAPQADITPDGLDRAALEACVGDAFFPGIETGGRPIVPPPPVPSHRGRDELHRAVPARPCQAAAG